MQGLVTLRFIPTHLENNIQTFAFTLVIFPTSWNTRSYYCNLLGPMVHVGLCNQAMCTFQCLCKYVYKESYNEMSHNFKSI